jgi:hypothetical protein
MRSLLAKPLGTMFRRLKPPGRTEEIEEHLRAGKPAMIYFSNAPVRPDSVDEAQYRALRKFRAKQKPLASLKLLNPRASSGKNSVASWPN